MPLAAGQPRLGGRDLELALAHILQVLRWPDYQVDDGADEGKQRRGRGAADQHRVPDPAPCIGVGPVDQRDPEDHEEQQQEVDREVQPIVGDPEDRQKAH
jgi:hypothetical protein